MRFFLFFFINILLIFNDKFDFFSSNISFVCVYYFAVMSTNYNLH